MYYQNYEDYMRSILGYPNYNNTHNSTNYNDTYNDYSNMSYQYAIQGPRYSNEILNLYPEIYKIVNPMVCKICEVNTKPITQELIEQMTDEIYMNLESDNSVADETVNTKVNIGNDNINVNNDRTNNILNSQSMYSKVGVDNRNNQEQSSRNNMNTKNYNTKNEDLRNTNKVSKNYVNICKEDKKNSRQEKSKELAYNEKSAVRVQGNRQVRGQNNTLRDLIKILILNRLLGQSGHWRPQRPQMPPIPPRPISPQNRYSY